MSNTLKVVHICSHVIKDNAVSTVDIGAYRGPSLVDTIPGIAMKKIESIKVADGSLRFPGIHFRLIGTSSVAWVDSPIIPPEGDHYMISAAIETHGVRSMGQEECLICGGNGWYASATELTEKRIDYSTSVEKMVQDFIKILLTDIRYASYGTSFKEVSMSAMTDHDAMKIMVSNAIKDAESQLKRKQYEMEMNGIDVDDDEKIVSANIVDIEMDDISKSLYVHIDILTQSNLAIEIGVQS